MVVMRGNVVLGTESLLLHVIKMPIWECMVQACNVCIKFELRYIVL